MRSIGLVLISVVLGAASTARAAEWSAPVTVSAPHTFAQPVTLTQSTQVVTATWGWGDGVGLAAPGGFSSAEARFGSGFGAEHRAPAGIVDVASDGPRRAVAVTQTEVPRGRTERGPLRYAIGAAFSENGRFGALHRLRTAAVASRASIASNGGPVIAGWIETTGKRRIVQVVTRNPGGAFSRPTTLSGRGQADGVDVAASRRGDLAVVFVRNGKVLARVKRAGGRWGAIRELAKANGPTQWQLISAIAENGRVVVAWRRYTLRRVGVPGTRALESTSLAAGKSAFSAPQVVEADGVVGPSLLATGAAAFALVWTDQDGIASNGPATPRVALTGTSPRFGAPLSAAPAAGGLRDTRIASGPLGLYAVWVEPQPDGDGDGLGRGALLPPGASAFLAPEQVTPSENVHEVGIAADVTGGAFVAAWSARPEGTGPGIPLDQIRSFVRAARRTG